MVAQLHQMHHRREDKVSRQEVQQPRTGHSSTEANEEFLPMALHLGTSWCSDHQGSSPWLDVHGNDIGTLLISVNDAKWSSECLK